MALYSEWHKNKVSFGLTSFLGLWLAKLDGGGDVVVDSPCNIFSEAGAACILTNAGETISTMMIEDLKLH